MVELWVKRTENCLKIVNFVEFSRTLGKVMYLFWIFWWFEVLKRALNYRKWSNLMHITDRSTIYFIYIPSLKSIWWSPGVGKVIYGSYNFTRSKNPLSYRNFSKILSEQTAPMHKLAAIKRRKKVFLWVKLCACHITLPSQIS